VLYELVTNKKPFDLENDFSMMLAHVERTPAPPIEINHYTPPALNDIILTALAKEPEGRFQSADLFRDNLLEVKKIVAVEDEDAPALQSAFGIAPWKPLLSRLACAATHSRALKYSVAIVLLSLTVSLFGIWRQASFQRTTTSKVAPAMASKAPAPSSSKAAEIPAPVAIPTAQPNSPFAAYRIEVSDSVPSGFKNVANSAPLVAPKSVAGKASAITVSTDLLSEPKALAAKPVREAINEVPLTPPSLHYEPPKETVATVSKEPPADPQPKEKKGNRFRKALSAVLHPYKRKSSDRSGMSAGAIRESRPGDINGETEVPKR
jgi:serine/threonine protein kinase